MYQVNSTKDIAEVFKKHLKAGNFVKDKTGVKTIEVIGASFVADKPAIFGVPNQEYIKAEIDWYNSKSTNISDIYPEGDKEPPQAWQYTANVHGEINSNYGYLIYSPKYLCQYEQVLNELTYNMDSRRATMVYQRPSIWFEFDENGKNDFICTNAVTYYIRDRNLHCVVQMRSNDVVFGYKNDYAWQKQVLVNLASDLNKEKVLGRIGLGDIHWQVQNLHVYERHFDLIK